MNKRIFAFIRDTILLAIAIAVLLALPEGRAPVIENAQYTRAGQEPVPTNWPLNIASNSRVYLEAQMNTKGIALPTYLLSVSGCIEELLIDDTPVEEAEICYKNNVAINLEGIVQEGTQKLSVVLSYQQGEAFLDLQPAEQNKAITWSDVQYTQNNNRKPRQSTWPVRVPFESTLTLQFEMHLPIVHADAYLMEFSGCLQTLTINDILYKSLDEGVCNKAILDLGDYVKAGANTVWLVLDSRGATEKFSIRADETDAVFLGIKILIVLALVTYGFFRLP